MTQTAFNAFVKIKFKNLFQMFSHLCLNLVASLAIVLNFQLGADVKLHFVNGCDEVVDRILFTAIEKMEDFEIESIDLIEVLKPAAARKVWPFETSMD